jgi:DNA-binding CsgD family transcriptional regulator
MRSGAALSSEPVPVHQDHVSGVYRYAVRKGGIDSAETVAENLGLELHESIAAIEHLIECRLLRREHDAGRLLVPVDPKIAAAALVSPMEREIYQRRERIAQIRERIEMFHPDYAATGQPADESGSVDQFVGALEVRGYLNVASEACRGEIMVLQPSRPDDDELDLPRLCANLLDRGITVRIVCQHRNRADLTALMRIKNLADAGAEVRTVSHVPRAAVVLDRRLVVLLGSANGEVVASRVRNEGVVRFLLEMFDHQWETAMPLDNFESGYAEVTDDLRQTVAALMANGLTDEAIARKLGMSVRTCRRHIAALMRDLDAVSRFQAGVRAAQRSLVAGGCQRSDCRLFGDLGSVAPLEDG